MAEARRFKQGWENSRRSSLVGEEPGTFSAIKAGPFECEPQR
jgi:hypothetical protein